jgi:hypothetical protein
MIIALCIILFCYSVVATAYGVFSTLRTISLTEKLEAVGEQADESFDTLDQIFQRFDAKLKMELFSDEPVVRELVDDIVKAKETIHLVALKVYSSLEEDEEDEEEEK